MVTRLLSCGNSEHKEPPNLVNDATKIPDDFVSALRGVEERWVICVTMLSVASVLILGGKKSRRRSRLEQMRLGQV